jgi:hypothetical protein
VTQTRALTAAWFSCQMGRHRIMGRAAVTDATPATVQASPPSPSAGAVGGALGIARSIPSMPAPHAGGGAATAGSTALLSSEGKLILFGWHRAVYAVWMERLADYPVMYTGSESASAKAATIQRFLDGDARGLIMSLRSGAGIDGLQNVASTLVFGELDWSSGVHRQAIGRLVARGRPAPWRPTFAPAATVLIRSCSTRSTSRRWSPTGSWNRNTSTDPRLRSTARTT